MTADILIAAVESIKLTLPLIKGTLTIHDAGGLLSRTPQTQTPCVLRDGGRVSGPIRRGLDLAACFEDASPRRGARRDRTGRLRTLMTKASISIFFEKNKKT